VKKSCGTLKMSGIEVYHTCKAEAQLLKEGEVASQKGNNSVANYNVDDVILTVEASAHRLQRY
jgi:hypothetical protein